MAKGQIKQAQAKIDKNEFEELCRLQCTETEIAGVFGVCRDTLLDWCYETYGSNFSTIFKEKREGGKPSLRRTQWELARTNPTMAIWLGKQYLGQRDSIDAKVETTIDNITPLIDMLKESKDNE